MQKNNVNTDFRKFAISKTHATGSNIDVYNSYIAPYIMEERELHVTQLDVFSRMMMERVIFLGAPINDDVANVIQAQLLYLESTDPKKDIQIYINSPGGYVYSGLGIYDTMQFIEPDIATICTGISASMAAILLSAGTKGKRSALPHSRILIHQPSGQAEGQQSDIEIMANEMRLLKTELHEILVKHTGQPLKRIIKDSDRDFWMTAQQAQEYGIIDTVLFKDKKV
jgi:ATP-dependent Clp protease protease subunit